MAYHADVPDGVFAPRSLNRVKGGGERGGLCRGNIGSEMLIGD